MLAGLRIIAWEVYCEMSLVDICLSYDISIDFFLNAYAFIFFLFLFNQANHILIRRAHVNLISDLRQQSSSLTQPQVFSTGMTRAKGALSLTSDAWQQPYHITLPSSHILLLRPTPHLLLPLATYDTHTLQLHLHLLSSPSLVHILQIPARRQRLCDCHQPSDIPRCIRRTDEITFNHTLTTTSQPAGYTETLSRCVAAP